MNRYSSQFKNNKGIAIVEKIMIGGIEQGIMIRGNNRNKPLLLSIHGGPGITQMPYARHFQKDLENHFIVVNWDQRGAGLSYNEEIDITSMTIEQIVNDALELSNILKQRFNQNKIYIMGHSWGSIIGMLAIQKQPDSFYAYYGIGQVVNISEGEKIAYKYIYEKAIELNNSESITELKNIGVPPWNEFNHITIFYKWIENFRVGFSYKKELAKKVEEYTKNATEYLPEDKEKQSKWELFSMNSMGEELSKINMNNYNLEVKIPVFFIGGTYDYITPTILAKKYLEQIKSPFKRFLEIGNTAHAPNFEKKDIFSKFIINNAKFH